MKFETMKRKSFNQRKEMRKDRKKEVNKEGAGKSQKENDKRTNDLYKLRCTEVTIAFSVLPIDITINTELLTQRKTQRDHACSHNPYQQLSR